jgi:ABC-type transporter Mla subunit MlaD
MLEDISELSGLERFQQILGRIADTIGEPIFEALNAELSRLADWLEANPEKVDAFAKSLGDLATKGLQEVFKILENVDWENLATNISSLVQSLSEGDWESAKRTLEGIAAAFQAIADAIQTIRDLLTTLDQLKQMGEMGVSVLGPESRVGELTALERASLANAPAGNGGGGSAPQRVVVDINLKSDMLDAQIRQGADGAVTSALNAAAEEFHKGGH